MFSYQNELKRLYADNRNRMDALVEEMVSRIIGTIARLVNPREEIAYDRQRRVRNEVRRILVETVLTGSPPIPYRFNPDGVPTPTSPFMRVLWDTQQAAIRLAVEQQAQIMRRELPETLIGQLQNATRNPFGFGAAIPESERTLLNRYQMPLTAERADGRTLDERLFVATSREATKLTALLRELFAERRTFNELSEIITAYYLEGLPRLNKPYGQQGYTELMRIAESEPVFAYSSAAAAAAGTHPFIQTVTIFRTRNVPCEICDPIANGSPYYLQDAPLPGYHAHCVCGVLFNPQPNPRLLESWVAATDWLSYGNPLNPRQFSNWLIQQTD